jgi:hypothetical protein
VTAHHRGRQFTVTAGSPVSFPGEYRTLDALPGDAPRSDATSSTAVHPPVVPPRTDDVVEAGTP